MTNISHRAFSEFVGIRYEDMDCVDLVIYVQNRIFNRKIEVDSDRNHMRRNFRKLLRENLHPVTGVPTIGDLVLMKDFNAKYPEHIGTYFCMAGDEWVLHTTAKTDSVFHRIREVSNFGILVEGIYTWK